MSGFFKCATVTGAHGSQAVVRGDLEYDADAAAGIRVARIDVRILAATDGPEAESDRQRFGVPKMLGRSLRRPDWWHLEMAPTDA